MLVDGDARRTRTSPIRTGPTVHRQVSGKSSAHCRCATTPMALTWSGARLGNYDDLYGPRRSLARLSRATPVNSDADRNHERPPLERSSGDNARIVQRQPQWKRVGIEHTPEVVAVAVCSKLEVIPDTDLPIRQDCCRNFEGSAMTTRYSDAKSCQHQAGTGTKDYQMSHLATPRSAHSAKRSLRARSPMTHESGCGNASACRVNASRCLHAAATKMFKSRAGWIHPKTLGRMTVRRESAVLSG